MAMIGLEYSDVWVNESIDAPRESKITSSYPKNSFALKKSWSEIDATISRHSALLLRYTRIKLITKLKGTKWPPLLNIAAARLVLIHDNNAPRRIGNGHQPLKNVRTAPGDIFGANPSTLTSMTLSVFAMHSDVIMFAVHGSLAENHRERTAR
jgi:hypothetical protein